MSWLWLLYGQAVAAYFAHATLSRILGVVLCFAGGYWVMAWAHAPLGDILEEVLLLMCGSCFLVSAPGVHEEKWVENGVKPTLRQFALIGVAIMLAACVGGTVAWLTVYSGVFEVSWQQISAALLICLAVGIGFVGLRLSSIRLS